jgi:Zn-dependent protease/predicted transcriptional regulator
MKGSLRIAEVRGIPIRAHFTLLFVIPYLAFLMATQFYPVAQKAGVRGESVLLPPWAWGLLLAVLLFVCVLLHELGHSLVALRAGGRVSSITLMLLGGVSELRGLPQTPGVEGRVAIAGPLVSLALAGLGYGLYALVGGPPDVRFGLFYLAQINLVLAIFNLLPAFPMDGGRVLRSLLSRWWPRVKATQIAAAAGTAFAILFFIAGFAFGNLILMLVGLFVWSGAQAESQMVQREAELSGLRVRDVMSLSHETVDAADPVSHTAEVMAETRVTSLPVVSGSELVGVVAAHHLEALPANERDRTPTAAITRRDAPRLEADELLSRALEQMAEKNASEAPVLHEGFVVGVLEVSDLARVVRLRKLRAPEQAGIRARAPSIGPQPEALHRESPS